jgi:hypothetical protein
MRSPSHSIDSAVRKREPQRARKWKPSMHRSLHPLGVALLVVVSPSAAYAGELPSQPLPGLYARSLPPLDLRTGVLDPLVVQGPRQPPLARRALDRMTRTFDRPETFAALSVGYMTLNGLDWATT